MSEPESLLPYLREEKDADRPVIVVDSREANTAAKIVKSLMELDVDVRIKPLEKGDYVISEDCAFERKTVHDFVYTLTRRHLFEQLYLLKDAYLKPFIIIEGYLPIIYKFSRINPSSVWGAMFALAKHGIGLIQTMNHKETADFLYTSARQEQIVERRPLILHPVKKIETISDAQVFFISSLPNVGREKAVAILRSFENPLNALVNVDRWAKDVHGLGPKITDKVKKVLYTSYSESGTET
ncbi:MAG: hypothetical protein OEZ48_08705 [Candidatus Bathyarchaeota archaeon]|nr:hypothetical protein [Candidatus Bathyarchaeota archaeon]MDH5687926.1 hypothetical protein [Candidatus Bathyarchaeota archaeon]